jgi:two-component system phosphate regulon sensor histidine kinase PhoR
MATLVILVLTIIMDVTVKDRYQEIILGDLEKYSLFAKETFRDAFGQDAKRSDDLIEDLSEETGVRITLIAVDGTVLADSEKDASKMENHAGRPEIQEAMAGGIGTSTRYSTTLRDMMSYVAMPVYENDQIKGVVRLSLKLQAVELIAGEMTRRIVLISLAVWIAALILTLLFSSVFFSSVKQMVRLTKRVASGDFSRRAMVKSQDEVGELAAGLNEMSEKLQSFFVALQTQHDELDAIINSMAEGVLVLDSNMRIRLANDSFRYIFSVRGPVDGKVYIEAVRSVGLKEMVDELSEKGQVKGKQVEFGEKVLIGNGIALTGAEDGAGSYVLVFHDRTSDIELETIKADFVANASHELRTPLSAIKGYLEALEDEDPETQKAFIQIIRRNVERISNLVSDLLLLSRMESSSPRINLEEVELPSLADDVVKLVDRIASDKGLDLRVDIEPDLTVIGDPFLLEQMLLNLLDNAIKYTEKGEVILKAEKDNSEVLISVSDTGVGIPQAHIPRIFERFYRVDKARSRDLGGTGLGLSIVKHIVQIHQGEIQVESQHVRGTTFTISLPLNLEMAFQDELEYDSRNPLP